MILIIDDKFWGNEKYKLFPEKVYIPKITNENPIIIVSQDKIGWIKSIPQEIANPTEPKILMKPKPKAKESWNDFIIWLGIFIFCLLLLFVDKNIEIYTGNITNPHGFTVASIPDIKEKLNGIRESNFLRLTVLKLDSSRVFKIIFSNSSSKNKPIDNENTKIKINIADNFLLIMEVPVKNNSFYKHEKLEYQFCFTRAMTF